MSTIQPPYGENEKKLGAYFAPLRVSAQDVPNMTVRVQSGSYFNGNNDFVSYSGGSSPTITAPVSNSAWAIIALSNYGTISVITGASSVNPSFPAIPDGELPLAAVYVSSTTTAITSSMISDIRPFLRTTDIVPGLSSLLTSFVTTSALSNALVLKSDVDGTSNGSFILNKGNVTTLPYASFMVNRGSFASTGIRWNEVSTQWEFTNDGTTWNAFAASGLVPVGTPVTNAFDKITTDMYGRITATSSVTSSDIAGTFSIVPNQVFAGPTTGAAATPAFRHLVATDIPTIAQSQVTNLVTDLAGKANVATSLAGYGITDLVVNSFNTRSGAITLTSADVENALGFVPYNVTNPAGYVTAITAPVTSFNTRTGAIVLQSLDVTGALGFTPYNATNPAGYITAASAPVQSFNTRTGAITLSSGDVTTALGFTPYNATNPAGYVTASGSVASATTATTATSATTATTATNIAGGTAGQIPFQTSAGLTTYDVGTDMHYDSTTHTLTVANVQGNAATATTATSATTALSAHTVIDAAQPNITSVGTLTSLTSSGQITSTVITGTAPFVVASTTPVANLSIGGNAATATSATSATSATTATTATNLAGGTTGQIPFQSAAGTTAYDVGTDLTYTAGTNTFNVTNYTGTSMTLTGVTKSAGYNDTSIAVNSTASLTTATLTARNTYFTSATPGASFAITLPTVSASDDGMMIKVYSTAARASTTWVVAGTATTTEGLPTSLSATTAYELQYVHATTTWYIS